MRNTDLLSRCAGGIIVGSFFLLTFSCKKGSDERVGIIPNPSFEESEDGAPKYWKSYRWTSRSEAQFEHSLSGRGEEGRSVMIASEKGADASWSGNVPVRPFSTYRLSGWIKTENLASKTGRGALFNLHGMDDAETEEVTGTQDWTRVEMTFDTERNNAVQINCLFGGWGTATGKAWYDDLELEWLSSREIAHPSITIGTSRSGEPISKYIYGQFIEHLGRCIYGGIWSEMLEDRKFFYPVIDTYAPWSVKDDPWVKAGLFPILVASPWKVVGPAGTVQMDTQNPFVGEHTPVVRLTGDGQACGISQEGLALIKGKAYEGRIVLAGDVEAAPVEVRLVLDSGKALSHRIEILQTEYQTTPFRFEASSSSDNAVLEIVSRGRGSLRVGTVSLMPADHIKGFRADVIALLKELDSPIYRWPGGNFVSGYDWRDGIGERDRRPPRKNPAWTGVEHNDVGIHEYMDLMELIGAEPFIAVNTGLGTMEEVGEEVEYCNSSADTPTGRLRAENGHPESFRVKWWAVGNEMYGSWQLGHMPLEEYVKKHNRVVEAMRRVDPSIRLVAVGEVGRWSQTMLKECGDYMDLLSEHIYVQEKPGVLGHVNWLGEEIKRKADAHRKYRQEIPGLAEKDIRIAMDEWNYWYGDYLYGELGVRYHLKDALGTAAGLHEYFRNNDLYFMANYAQTVNVIGAIKTTKTDAAFETTGLVLKLYRKHFGTIPVEVRGTSGLLDVFAALSVDEKILTLSVVNPTLEKQDLPVQFEGISLTGAGRKWEIAGSDPMAYNEPGKKPRIVIGEKGVKGISDKLKLPLLSITLYALDVQSKGE